MNIPGGDDMIYKGTEIIFDYWAKIRAERTGEPATLFAAQPDHVKRQWMAPQRAFAELVIVATVTDQLSAMDDGSDAGAARHRAISRYCLDELDLDPVTMQPREKRKDNVANHPAKHGQANKSV